MINSKIRKIKFQLKIMGFQICNRNISLKWLIALNIILILALFVFIDFYFYKKTQKGLKDVLNIIPVHDFGTSIQFKVNFKII